MTETRDAFRSVGDAHRGGGMTLTPRERERALAELADVRHKRDRLAAELAGLGKDHAYSDDDCLRLNDRLIELTFFLDDQHR